MTKFDLATAFPTFERAWASTTALWQARSRREQWLFGIVGALLVTWLLAATVILPIQRARAAALAEIRTYENLTARLHAAGTLSESGGQQQASGPPDVVLSTMASQYGIVPVINNDASGLRVTVADAPYDALMHWITAIEQTSSIRVIRMRVDRRPASGFVSADLMVRA